MFKLFNLVFKNQAVYSTTASQYLTQTQVIEEYQGMIGSNMPQYTKAIQTQLQYGSQADTEARYAWKYACSRGVSGTPTFLANGVVINGAGNWKADDWRKFLNGGYLGENKTQKPLRS